MSERAVDFSAWTGDISPSAVQTCIDNGITLAIVQGYGSGPMGTRVNPNLQQQAVAFLSRGVKLATYSWPAYQHWQVYEEFFRLGLPRPEWIGLDVEAGTGVTHKDVDWIKKNGWTPVIYASESTWTNIMGGDTSFADVPLWDARYPLRVWDGTWYSNVQAGFRPYGGWTERFGWQFAGTTTLNDDQFDLNIFEVKEEDMALTQEDKDWIHNEIANLLPLLNDMNDDLDNCRSALLADSSGDDPADPRRIIKLATDVRRLAGSTSGAHTH